MADRDTIINDELELITEFLHQRLDPARADEVCKRLERDPEFLELATPLLFAWSVKPEWERAENVAEAEKHWKEFTKRADFTYHRKRRIKRRNWLIALVTTAIVGLVGFVVVRQRTGFTGHSSAIVYADSGWQAIAPYVLAKATDLKNLNVIPGQDGMVTVELTGDARFRVNIDTANLRDRPARLRVVFAAGEAATDHGEFEVLQSGDSARVRVYTPPMRRIKDGSPVPTIVEVNTPWGMSQHKPLRVPERGGAFLRRQKPPVPLF